MQTWSLIAQLTPLLGSPEVKLSDHEQSVITTLTPSRTLLRRRYFEYDREQLSVHYLSCGLLITRDGRIGRQGMKHVIDGKDCVDKKGGIIAGWLLIENLGLVTLAELEKINCSLAAALHKAQATQHA